MDDDRDPAPTPPQRPQPDECCQSGCVPCVFDLYEEELERYNVALREWRLRHPELKPGENRND